MVHSEEGQPLHIRVLTDLDDILPLQREWEGLRLGCGGSVFSSHHWTLEWLRHFSDVFEPRVLTLEREGELEAVAPFVLSKKRYMGMGVRTLSMTGWAGGTLEYYETGVLHRPGKEEPDLLLRGLGEMNWNSLQLYGFPDCPFHNSLLERAKGLWPDAQVERVPCPYLDLAGREDVASLFGTRNRRTVRKLLRELSETKRLESRALCSPGQVERAMLEYVEMHRTRWASRGGSIFQDQRQRDFLLGMAKMAAERSEACIYEVRIDGELGAQALSLFEPNKVRIYRISMNDDLMDFSPGYLLFHEMLTRIMKKGITIVDLGAGAEEFKYRLGAQDAFVLGLRAKRGTLKFASRLGSAPGVDRILRRTGLKDKVLKGVS